MKKFWTFIAVLFLVGMFLTASGQPTEPLGQAIGNGIEGGFDFLASIWDSITQ